MGEVIPILSRRLGLMALKEADGEIDVRATFSGVCNLLKSGPVRGDAFFGERRGLLIIVTFRNDSSRVAIYATVSTKVIMKQYLRVLREIPWFPAHN